MSMARYLGHQFSDLLPTHKMPSAFIPLFHSYCLPFFLESALPDRPFFSTPQCSLIPTQSVSKKCWENQADQVGRVSFPYSPKLVSLPPSSTVPLFFVSFTLLISISYCFICCCCCFCLFVVCPFPENVSSMRTGSLSSYTFVFCVFNT